jgi:hypothetical protein
MARVNGIAAGLLFLFEFVLSVVVLVWTAAFFGFAGESHRGARLSVAGWIIGGISAAISLLPLIVTLWLVYRRFFSEQAEPNIAIWAPLVLAVGVGAVCYVLVQVFDSIGYLPKP